MFFFLEVVLRGLIGRGLGCRFFIVLIYMNRGGEIIINFFFFVIIYVIYYEFEFLNDMFLV